MKCGIGSYGYSIGAHNELRDVYVGHLDMEMNDRKMRNTKKERQLGGVDEWGDNDQHENKGTMDNAGEDHI